MINIYKMLISLLIEKEYIEINDIYVYHKGAHRTSDIAKALLILQNHNIIKVTQIKSPDKKSITKFYRLTSAAYLFYELDILEYNGIKYQREFEFIKTIIEG